MKTEFNPGDKVFVPGKVSSIEITKDAIYYNVVVKDSGSTNYLTIKEQDLMQLVDDIQEVKP